MSRIRLQWFRVVGVAVCAFLAALAQERADTNNAASPSPQVETALRALVERYFAGYVKKDIEAVIKLWSEKSPELAERRKALAESFAKEDYGFGDLKLTRIRTEQGKARLRASVERKIIAAQSGQARNDRLAMAFELVAENGQWKIWVAQVAAYETAAMLAAAATAEEQRALIEQEDEAVAGDAAVVLLQQAGREYAQQNFSPALKLYQLGLMTSEKGGYKQGMTAALNNIGAIYYHLNDYAQALAFHQRSLQVKQELNDKTGIAKSLNNIGNVYYDLGDYQQAFEYYQNSLRLKEETNDQAGQAASLNNLGSVRQTQGDYRQALFYLKQSLQISEQRNDKAASAGTLNNIGNIYDSQGNNAQAIEYYERSLRLSEEAKDKTGVARALGNLGTIFRRQGRFAEAMDYQQRGLRLNEELESRTGIAASFNNIANLYADQGQHAQAIEYYQRSLKLNEEMNFPSGVADCWTNLATTYLAQGANAEARPAAEKGIALSRQLGRPDLLWEALHLAGQAYLRLGQLPQARQAFAEAISTIEQMRSQIVGDLQQRRIFFEDRTSPYASLIELLVEQRDAASALAVAERAKAKVLLDTIESGRDTLGKELTPAERAQEQQILTRLTTLNAQLAAERQEMSPDKKRLAELTANLDRTRIEYESFLTSLYAAHPRLRIARGSLPPLSLGDAATLLGGADAALLEFAVGEERTLLFVLTKRASASTPDLQVFSLPIKAKDLGERARKFRQTLANPKLDLGFKQESAALYDLLLKPAQAQLKGKISLVIVPDGALWELPFQALSATPNRFLIEQAAISYAPSLTYLREMQRKGKPATSAPASLLAIGNPALAQRTMARAELAARDEKLAPLPLAEKEALALTTLYGARQSKVYIGAAALEERFKAEAGDYRVLHLATHGVLDDHSPMYSHVLLAQTGNNDKEDGLLEAWEIMNLDLKADLAVLSACETARGRVSAGEGVIGLSWALFVAGVPTTVVSQWKVLDLSTQELMVEFHRQLKTNPAQGKAESLRQAALKVMKIERHPFHWAGFILVGDGR